MLHFDLDHKPRVAAVSYLNTLPLVWGMLHGEQSNLFDMEFCVPAECADRLGTGAADIGIVPVAELERLALDVIPGTGIACEGPVRSILLVSQVPVDQIRTLATDSSSRSSVMLSKVLLARKYGVEPELVSMRPELAPMLEKADAALIIGDPALHLDPATLPFQVLDLGHGKGHLILPVSRRALPNVDKLVFTAVDQRPQQNATHQAEDGGIGSNSQCQCQDHRDRQAFAAPQRPQRHLKILKN